VKPQSEPGSLLRILYWTLPSLLCLLVFYRGLLCWFQQDDFSWLTLEVHSTSDFWRMLLEPRAQGTIRPWSERFFFIVFRKLFGLNAFPYRLFVFLTQVANLVLLTALARRILGDRLAAVLMAMVWGLNIALLIPMAWTAAYNQILCSFFYLSALLLFVRHVETGRWRYYWWQWAVFLLGFGALETIVAYPLVLLAYCLCLARVHTWKTLPLMVPAALYAGLHIWVIQRASAGPYAFHMDGSLFHTLGRYWARALGPLPLSQVVPIGQLAALALAIALTVAWIAAMAWAGPKERRVAVFGLAWFLVALAPVLPLRDHLQDYYLTIPAIGLALAVAAAWRAAPRWAAAMWLLVYWGCSVAFLQQGIRTYYERSQAVRRFLAGVQEIRAVHPDKTILLAGVEDALFYGVIHDEGFRVAGVRNVYLAPTNEGITPRPELRPVSDFQLPARATLDALEQGLAVVYEASGGRLRNITSWYTALASALLRPTPPRRVSVGEPRLEAQLGPGWHEIQGYHRWMGRRAELRLAGPQSPTDRLRLQAIHSEHPNAGPARLTVSVNGLRLGSVVIRDHRSGEHVFSLPAALVGVPEITVTFEIDRTFRAPQDDRDLGLAFGVVELI